MKLRDLPSVDELLRDERLAAETHELAVAATRLVLERAREEIRAGRNTGDLVEMALSELARARRPSLRRVLNATGVLVHTNHYVCESMLPYEGDPTYARLSAIRYERATELLRSTAPGTVTEETLRGFLSDHEHSPDSLCKHEADGRTSVTCFWCVADVTEGRVAFGRGNPCDSVEQEYVFADHGA